MLLLTGAGSHGYHTQTTDTTHLLRVQNVITRLIRQSVVMGIFLPPTTS